VISPADQDSKLFLRLLFWAAALFALIMALIPHGVELPGNPNDKIQHAIAFATLGFLAGFAYPRLGVIKVIAALSLFGAFIEVAQAIPALHRDSDPLDWVADTVACSIVLLAIRWRLGPRR
jgi:hypothetical protein